MTMIAYTKNFNFPILVGDILISDTNRSHRLLTPTYSKNIFAPKEDIDGPPAELRQKLYVINDNICIGLAGSLVLARHFLEDFKVFCKVYDNITHGQILKFLEEYNLADLEEHISFLIVVVEKSNLDIDIVPIVHGRWLQANSIIFDRVIATGSGASAYLNSLANIEGFGSCYQPETFMYSMIANLSHLGMVLANERFSQTSFADYWGAGFEIVYFDGIRFAKIPSLTYIISYVTIDDLGEPSVPVPQKIIHFNYAEDLLIIYAFEFTSGNVEIRETELFMSYTSFIIECFGVRPIDCTETVDMEPYLQNASFESDWVLMTSIVQSSKDAPAIFNSSGINAPMDVSTAEILCARSSWVVKTKMPATAIRTRMGPI